MKHCVFIFYAILTFSIFDCQVSHAQNGIVPEKIALAIRHGDAKKLSLFFNTDIELIILDKEGLYSKEQAGQILKDYFIHNVPSSFEINQHGSRNASTYFIGTLFTNTGRYRLSFFMERDFSGEDVIIHFRIEDDNN